MEYAVVTFGCRVNQADSFDIESAMRQAGAVPAPPDRAQLVVVNTCSVTASADQGARQVIRRLNRANPLARIVVTGCYATASRADVAALPGVVDVVSNLDKASIVPRLLAMATPTSADRYGEGEGACGAVLGPGLMGRTAYTLRVQTGCDEACAYCIIPSTRGPGRSRPLDDVLTSADAARAAGFREIVLTGVHLGAWGRDLEGPLTLNDLVRSLGRRRGDVRHRLSSLEPMDCPPALVDLMAADGRFAPHFHLPLQHASDGVLARMRRPYRLDDYRRTVDHVRCRIPDAALGTDLIVGFPGETDADHRRLTAYLESSPLTHLHVFPYSTRAGTEAARLADHVPPPVVRERTAEVRAIGRALVERFHRSQDGAVRRALTVDDGSVAVTDNYLKVRVPPTGSRNRWIDVRLAWSAGGFIGDVLDRPIGTDPQA